MRRHLVPLLLLAAAPVASPARAGDNGFSKTFVCTNTTQTATEYICLEGKWVPEALLDDAAASADLPREAYVALRKREFAAVADAARAVAAEQGLDAASTERYVAARVAAHQAAEYRRLVGAASPATRAALGLSPDRMDTSAPTGLLVLFGALAVVAAAAQRLRREPA